MSLSWERDTCAASCTPILSTIINRGRIYRFSRTHLRRELFIDQRLERSLHCRKSAACITGTRDEPRNEGISSSTRALRVTAEERTGSAVSLCWRRARRCCLEWKVEYK